MNILEFIRSIRHYSNKDNENSFEDFMIVYKILSPVKQFNKKAP